MNRREFLMASSCILATPAVALAAQAYEPGLVKQLLSEGKTVFVDYTTEWCTTCAAQKRTLARLLKDNPAYGEKIEFVTIDLINLAALNWPKSLVFHAARLWLFCMGIKSLAVLLPEPPANKSKRSWTRLYPQPWPLRAQTPDL
jgi:thiol-disulfide isomerase/thioredoxin